MPVTPFHLGPGAAVKVVIPAYFSLLVFGFTQVVIDLESGWFLATGGWPVHRVLHGYAGAALVIPLAALAGRPLCNLLVKIAHRLGFAGATPPISWTAAVVGAAVGALSHVLLDSIMHADMRPFAPLSDENPMLRALSLAGLHALCLASGAAAGAVWLARRLATRGSPAPRVVLGCAPNPSTSDPRIPTARAAGDQETVMSIKVGDKLPAVKLKRLGAEGMEEVDTGALFAGKKVVLFSVPGAFTPTCSKVHLPGYIAKADEIKALGVDDIVCLAVNDPFVMKVWGEQNEAGGKVTMLPDGNGAFTSQLGLELDGSGAGLGKRGKRFSLVAEDGVVKQLNVEDAAGEVAVSGAESCLLSLKK